jgi:hypothetical protein
MTMLRFVVQVAVCLALLPLAVRPDAVAAQGKPPLLDEIVKVMEAGGVDAAKIRFNELYPARADAFDIDLEAFGSKSAAYLKEGKMNEGLALAQIMSTLTAPLIEEAMAAQKEILEQYEAQMPEIEPEEEMEPADEEAARVGFDLGPPREDLARFSGLYGDAQGDETRRLFVLPSCEGHLVVGAMWGDVAPWWMRSDGDASFSRTTPYFSMNVRFQIGPDGRAAGFTHDQTFLGSPIPRVGEVPAAWGACIPTHER